MYSLFCQCDYLIMTAATGLRASFAPRTIYNALGIRFNDLPLSEEVIEAK